MEKTFGLIGGDRRQAELSRLLAADGNTVHTYGLDAWKPVGAGSLDRAAGADVIVLPLPLCRGDGVLNCQEGPMPTLDLFRRLRSQQRVLAGQVKPQQRREAADCGLCLEDYFLREELTVANAAATAEGAVQVAMERLDETLLGMECLVLGFGAPTAGGRWRPGSWTGSCPASARCSTPSPRPSWAGRCWSSCLAAACWWTWRPSRASTWRRRRAWACPMCGPGPCRGGCRPGRRRRSGTRCITSYWKNGVTLRENGTRRICGERVLLYT